MAQPVVFPGANTNLTAPVGQEETVNALPAFRNGTTVTSCWRFTPDELRAIFETGCVFVTTWSGITTYPLYVGSEDTTREVVAEHGIWKK